MTSEELLGFVEGLKWDEYIDDEDIKEILKKVKNRVNAIENGGTANGDGVDADAPRIKLVIVGDGAVGKTSLLLTYTSGNFPVEYVPTVFDNTTTEVNYKGQQILLQLWDTAGQEDYDRLRPLSYPGSDIVLLCYSCVSEASYEAIVEKWYPEVNLYAAGVPQLLVGTKYDMREEGIKDPHMDTLEAVDSEKGAELAKDIEAAGFIETSAKTGHNLKQMFDLAIQIVMERRNNEAAKEKKEKSSSSRDKKKTKKSSSSSKGESKKSSSSSKEKKSSSSEKKSSSKSSSSSSKKEKK